MGPYDVIGVTLLVCAVFGVVGNLISFSYFFSKKKQIPTMLYLCITSIDLMTSLLTVPIALNCLGEEVLHVESLCDIHGMLWSFSSRSSVFFVSVLSVSRTLVLIFPFKRLNKSLLLGITVVYCSLIVLEGLVPFMMGVHYTYQKTLVKCVWEFNFSSKAIDLLLYVILAVIPFIVPVFLVSISCYLSYRASVKCVGVTNSEVGMADRKRASVTIIVLTMVYVVFNIPYCLLNILSLFDLDWEFLQKWDGSNLFYNFAKTFSVSMNACFNPLVYFIFMKHLREYVLSRKKWFRSGSSSISEVDDLPPLPTYNKRQPRHTVGPCKIELGISGRDVMGITDMKSARSASLITTTEFSRTMSFS